MRAGQELTNLQWRRHELRRQLGSTKPVHHLRQGIWCAIEQTASCWCWRHGHGDSEERKARTAKEGHASGHRQTIEAMEKSGRHLPLL